MIRNRKVQEPIVAITKCMSEGKSLEKGDAQKAVLVKLLG